LGGLRVGRTYGRFYPYGDFLFGRGGIDYVHGYPNPQHTITYTNTSSYLLSPGVGADMSISTHLALKADAQLQRYGTPVTTSGRIYAEALTLGVVYRFDSNRPRRWALP
jgi:hypothetical protein